MASIIAHLVFPDYATTRDEGGLRNSQDRQSRTTQPRPPPLSNNSLKASIDHFAFLPFSYNDNRIHLPILASSTLSRDSI